MPSTVLHGLSGELFTALASKILACEEVYVFLNQENQPENKKAAHTGGLCRCVKFTLKNFVEQRPFLPWLPLSCA
ncbi:MAG: hypothetical protein WBN75_03375 [Verrucomicrobiia bacterium]